MAGQVILARLNLVILSEAKDLLAGIERRKMILRCAQDDKSFQVRPNGRESHSEFFILNSSA